MCENFTGVELLWIRIFGQPTGYCVLTSYFWKPPYVVLLLPKTFLFRIFCFCVVDCEWFSICILVSWSIYPSASLVFPLRVLWLATCSIILWTFNLQPPPYNTNPCLSTLLEGGSVHLPPHVHNFSSVVIIQLVAQPRTQFWLIIQRFILLKSLWDSITVIQYMQCYC